VQVLGLSGGFDLVDRNQFGFIRHALHDSAAVLVRDGVVVAGIEEERLNRIKHTNKAWISSARRCLETAGARIDDVDLIAYYLHEPDTDAMLAERADAIAGLPRRTAREWLVELLREAFGQAVNPAKLRFVQHHAAHAASSHYLSGFDDSLVLVLDGLGEQDSGMVFSGRGDRIDLLGTFSEADSLGIFYIKIIELLGYQQFDEYKVMGLAPYGDASQFRRQFESFYELLPDGGYRIHRGAVEAFREQFTRRQRGEAFTQRHRDLAAALQESLETVVFHMVRGWQAQTGHRHLCLSGGVAHNSTLTGKLLDAGLFDGVFVQPASHDAGCALGGALSVFKQERPETRIAPLANVFWGPHPPDAECLRRRLSQWSGVLAYEDLGGSFDRVADLLAAGSVIGWVQGRSEFGPRALGRRSILADPRPSENRDRVNRMIKMREGYRPFAPSIIEEAVGDYFIVPPARATFDYMGFVIKVREDKQALLGATTHVDGTARLQTVSRAADPVYWQLIRSFGERTGVPILLNTSFNNDVEPIVESTDDAIACFLTTGLDYLVIGDFLIRRVPQPAYGELGVTLPPHIEWTSARTLRENYLPHVESIVSEELATLLRQSPGQCPREFIEQQGLGGEAEAQLIDEVLRLWSRRFVRLAPIERL
jgi:carbamoyltransferase